MSYYLRMLIINISRPCDHKLHLELRLLGHQEMGFLKKDGRVVVLPCWGFVVMGSLMKVYSFRLCKLLIQYQTVSHHTHSFSST